MVVFHDKGDTRARSSRSPAGYSNKTIPPSLWHNDCAQVSRWINCLKSPIKPSRMSPYSQWLEKWESSSRVQPMWIVPTDSLIPCNAPQCRSRLTVSWCFLPRPLLSPAKGTQGVSKTNVRQRRRREQYDVAASVVAMCIGFESLTCIGERLTCVGERLTCIGERLTQFEPSVS